DRNRSHWSTSKTPSYTKSVSWQHHRDVIGVPLPAHCLDMQPDNSSIFFNELPSITGFPDFT
ncbi:hypothetical protein, partial [Escherichia coli]|uniref:hypothetical protein n=1 Tax=Escherichia coli TaxID=562 RepID=UPI001BC83F13